ncbi:hypothetical protein EIT37_23290 [Salmonella enterica subsp. enterica serovar Agama]|uniref:Uncharacterized protein n=1 Tax=Salmonella typhimurium TaxID=90371 RepID=A0A701H7V4_SALTM|nr:hypothetical protein [Salmonella enterica subsp. enterica]EAW3021628.1 hypothetical protein [Salmonella enterica]EAY4182642.1 hypothetical protein [Salmonella enterica subsp. enterica serovar Typhimurium]EBF8626541.1 hypothetical protein [Salmonella enterica subsp. enterica serovar Colindale]EBX1069604.1 hypothetical protein [Salmonella enterica subsp. enterica serovar Saintpaul]ECF3466154.1 hypothetical protein [Salmonella enterica subsp. enterica serovar Virchow]ECG7231896.1 hypothetical
MEFQTIRRSYQLGGIGSKRRLFSSHYHNERINHPWVKFTQVYSKSQYHAVNMLPSVAIMLLTCDRIQNVVCD